MPKKIDQYRVFIATPGGLEAERRAFRKTLELYTASDAEPRGVTFHPVGWEETLGGIGRPQAQINEDLRQCDYAVFVWHDRWGSPTGNGTMVGTEEEWKIAEELFKTGQVRNIAVFFKNVDERQKRDRGPQLKQVLAHKKRIEKEKRYLFKSFDQPDAFCDELRKHLAAWLRDHEKGAAGARDDRVGLSSPKIMSVVPPPALPESPPPNYRFWIQEANRLLEAEIPEMGNYSDALYCAKKALGAAASDVEWATATNILGVCQLSLNQIADAFASFSEIAGRFVSNADLDKRLWWAVASIHKGVTLRQLGRSEAALSSFDDVIACFGRVAELPLLERVAVALINKGRLLSELGRKEEAISIYDDVIARFGAAVELDLRKAVADALFSKGAQLGRSEQAISCFDEVIAKFGAANELALQKLVAKALGHKGITLGELGRSGDAIATYDEVITRFGVAGEWELREQVVSALAGKANILRKLGRSEEEISIYDDMITRFGAAGELALRVEVAAALNFKGVRLGRLGRRKEAISIYDDVIARFGEAVESDLRQLVGAALFYKGITLGELGRSKEAISVYDDVIARFGGDEAPTLRRIVEGAKTLRRAQGSKTESQ